MPRLDDHPTVRAVRERTPLPHHDAPLDVVWLRQLCLDAGADDVGFVEMERPELAGERKYISALFPQTKTLISFVCRMNREPIRRSTARRWRIASFTTWDTRSTRSPTGSSESLKDAEFEL